MAVVVDIPVSKVAVSELAFISLLDLAIVIGIKFLFYYYLDITKVTVSQCTYTPRDTGMEFVSRYRYLLP